MSNSDLPVVQILDRQSVQVGLNMILNDFIQVQSLFVKIGQAE
jgi:hypothetical protein